MPQNLARSDLYRAGHQGPTREAGGTEGVEVRPPGKQDLGERDDELGAFMRIIKLILYRNKQYLNEFQVS